MKCLKLALSMSICLFTAANAEESVELFPAKVSEWKQAGPGEFSVKDGVATSQGGMGLWWYAGKSFQNATFDIEFKLPRHNWNSGIFIRFPDPKNDPWIAVRQGYECQVSGGKVDKLSTGAIYDIQSASHNTLKKEGEWNLYQITTYDDLIIISINGELVNAYTTQKGRGDKQGHIGLQNHDPVSKALFRKITVREWKTEVLEEVLLKIGITRADWANYHAKKGNAKRWVDKVDLGPAWANTFSDYYQGRQRTTTLKGLALELSQQDQIKALFDTERMKVSSAYQGDFNWGGTPWTGSHGSHVTMKNQKQAIMETSGGAGWADSKGSFEDSRQHPGHGNFAKDHLKFNGHYRYSSQVILDYDVLGTRVLETISGKEKQGQVMAFRQMELTPSEKMRSMLVAHSKGSDVVITKNGRTAFLNSIAPVVKPPSAKVGKLSVIIDQTRGKWSALSMGAPSKEDIVDRSKNKQAYFRVIPEFLKTHVKGGDEEGVAVRLNDGLTSRNENDLDRVFFFENKKKSGRLEMDLGKLTDINRIHLYSEHKSNRAGQDVAIYVTAKNDSDSSLPENELVASGWRNLSSYNTKECEDAGKIGVAILAPKDESISDVRKVLFICSNPSAGNMHTFFSEIDLYGKEAPELTPLARNTSTNVNYGVHLKSGYGTFRDGGNGRLIVDFPASKSAEKVTIGHTSILGPVTMDNMKLLAANSPEPRELESLTKGGLAAFPEAIITKGTLSEEKKAWVTDQIGMPVNNPWNVKVRAGGFDFFPDGDSAAISTWEGDVWIVSGLKGDFKEFKWRRYASGLFESLGLKIVDGVVYVHGRDQITRLHDQNNDGEADWYECFNNDVIITKNFHEFAFSLQTDKAGNFYFTKGSPVLPGGRGFDKILPHNGTVLKLSKDGSKLEVVATGLRAPGGIGVGPNGEITTGENEGTWQPCCKLNYFTGKDKFLGTVPSGQHLKGQKMHLPLCYFPMYVDNSGGGQVWVPQSDNSWGLKQGELMHLSYGKSSLYRVLKEEINGQMQGGVVKIPVTLRSSAMRARFHPQENALYVLGFRGWQTNAPTPQAFQRVRYTGEAVTIPDQLKVTDKGVYIRFEKKLDPSTVKDRFNFKVERWKYIRSSQYGSGEFSVDNPDVEAEKRATKQESQSYKKHDQVEVVSSKLLSDGKTVFLHIPSMKPAEQMSIRYKLQFDDKQKAEGEIINTVHNLSPHKDMSLLEGSADGGVAKPQDLKPGLVQTINVDGVKDIRITRLPAQFVTAEESISDMLPSETIGKPFTSTWNGYLVIKERMTPQFSLQGKGSAVLKIDGKVVLNVSGDLATKKSDSIQLDPGVHQFELIYNSSADGSGQVRTMWETADKQIPLQSIPTSYFRHQTNPQIIKAIHTRSGRDTMSQHNCLECHQQENRKSKSQQPGPNMAGIGSRVSQQWLKQWLANAHALKPATTMPQFVDSTTDKGKQEVADMAAYLASLKVVNSLPKVDSDADVVKMGGDTFNRLGCIACHSLPGKQYDLKTKRTPLNNVHQKYSLDSLATFLKKPDRHHPEIKMPDFQLSDDEAHGLASYLRDSSEDKSTPAIAIPNNGDVARGKALITKHHCSSCHDGLPQSVQAVSSFTSILSKNWDQHGCATSKSPAKQPKLNLSKDEVKQLEIYRAHLVTSGKNNALTGALSLHDFADRQYKELNCAACHARDGEASKLSNLQGESAFLSKGMPVDDHQKIDQTRPQMTYIGEMLHTDYIHKILDGKVSTPRPWMTMRMPAFHSRSEQLAKGLAAQHGMAPSKLEQAKLDPQKIEVGKKLIGSNGGFACIICHANGETKALAAFEVEGVNFDQVAQRLRPGYYHRWMDNPQSVMPTKMPRYTLNNKSPLKDFDNDAAKQFEAIQEYLKSIHKDAAK